jgi:hypothetical protein
MNCTQAQIDYYLDLCYETYTEPEELLDEVGY